MSVSVTVDSIDYVVVFTERAEGGSWDTDVSRVDGKPVGDERSTVVAAAWAKSSPVVPAQPT